MNAHRHTEPRFGGRIGQTVAESEPSWPQSERSPGRRPNVVVIVLDDVGFAQLGCYGSSIATPNIDALAADGARYRNFHVAALCSPTRASLLTGRNHHAVGMGFLADYDSGYPGYRGTVTRSAATIAELLGDDGYGTYAVGKWHLTPPTEMSAAGPFDSWPTQRGFDRYYGFLWGEDDQFTPTLFHDQHHVGVPDDPEYHLSVDLVDRAHTFLADHLTARPDDPFLLYLAFGACHAPHQAPPEYLERYRGAFDHGWDVERQQVLERQIASGLVPPDTELAPRNPGVEPWETVTADRQRLYARMHEAFAGFMTHTDDQVGRLVSFLTDQNILDDTVIIVMSDNGASGEGGADGSVNEYRYFLGLSDSVEENLAAIDDIGTAATHNHYPMGWAQAGNTPGRYYKKYTYAGGVRVPLIVRGSTHVADAGTVREQFHHVVDIAPTVLELAGVNAPDTYRGVPQLPIHGVSMSYTLADAAAPGQRSTQYFETAGYRGIYADGYKAVALHEPGDDFTADRWELFDLAADFSECSDLAAADPDRVDDLVQRWWAAAEQYGVLPLDDRMGARVESFDPAADRDRYRMLAGTSVFNTVTGPNFSSRPFRVRAVVADRRRGDGGVLLAYGRRAAGFSLYVIDDIFAFDLNLAGRHTVIRSSHPVPVGDTVLELTVDATPTGATARLIADGDEIGAGDLPRLLPAGLGCLATQCGHNSPSAVSDAYRAPARFEANLVEVTIELGPRTEPTAAAELRGAIARQ